MELRWLASLHGAGPLAETLRHRLAVHAARHYRDLERYPDKTQHWTHDAEVPTIRQHLMSLSVTWKPVRTAGRGHSCCRHQWWWRMRQLPRNKRSNAWHKAQNLCEQSSGYNASRAKLRSKSLLRHKCLLNHRFHVSLHACSHMFTTGLYCDCQPRLLDHGPSIRTLDCWHLGYAAARTLHCDASVLQKCISSPLPTLTTL